MAVGGKLECHGKRVRSGGWGNGYSAMERKWKERGVVFDVKGVKIGGRVTCGRKDRKWQLVGA